MFWPKWQPGSLSFEGAPVFFGGGAWAKTKGKNKNRHHVGGSNSRLACVGCHADEASRQADSSGLGARKPSMAPLGRPAAASVPGTGLLDVPRAHDVETIGVLFRPVWSKIEGTG